MGSHHFNTLTRAHGWLALPAVMLAIAFCNSEGGSGSDASSSSSGGGIGGSGGASASTSVASFVGAGQATSGTGSGTFLPDASIPDGAFPPEPMVACDPSSDAGSDVLCPLPESTCALDRWLIYYENPECVDGICHFDAVAFDCWPEACFAGGCYLNMTAQ